MGAIPAVGDEAPDFELENHAGDTFELADFEGRWAVLFFYPKDNTPG